MKKRLVSLVIVLTLTISMFSVGVYADNSKVRVFFNENEILFDVNPMIINGRTMVPMRTIYEALGAKVDWDSATRTATGVKSGAKVSFTIDSPQMMINDVSKQLDSPAIIVDNRTLIPVRALAEGFGIDVKWDDETKTVHLYGTVPPKNLIVDGGFSNSSIATGWAVLNKSAILTKENDDTAVLTGTGNSKTIGFSNNARFDIGQGKRYVYHMEVMVEDEECEKIVASLMGGYGSFTISKPMKDKWYNITFEENFKNSGTQWPIQIKAHYADETVALDKILKVKNVCCINTSYDFGLGIDAPVFRIIDTFGSGNSWNDIENTEIKEIEFPILNNSDNDYIIDDFSDVKVVATKPIITFICDDAHKADFDKIRPISEKYSVPFTSSGFSRSGLTDGQMLYLQNELNWEFASHTYNHTPLGKLETTQEIESALKKSKEYFASIGINCDTLVYPEGSYDDRVIEIAKKYFKCAATTSAGKEGINKGSLNRFTLNRVALGAWGSSNTLTAEINRINKAIRQKGWIIYMIHPANSAHTEEHNKLICDIIEYAKAKNVEIMTFTDAFDYYYETCK